mmetsp:Transcript_21910/g.55055  ORF Transcript_21910/g.55055 Transcript_21910/m.55055 type:complete len:219 (+) Transcript_21910:896-1552(+)
MSIVEEERLVASGSPRSSVLIEHTFTLLHHQIEVVCSVGFTSDRAVGPPIVAFDIDRLTDVLSRDLEGAVVVVLHTLVVADVRLESSRRRGVIETGIAQMPLAHVMSTIAGLSHELGQSGLIQGHVCCARRLDGAIVLHPGAEGITTLHQRTTRWRTHRLCVVALHQNTVTCQCVQRGSTHLRAIAVANIGPAEIVDQEHDDVRTTSRRRCRRAHEQN